MGASRQCSGRCLLAALGCGVVLGCGAPPVATLPARGTESVPVADPGALARLDAGERRIEVAAGDCAAACAGLAEITHARIDLCAPRTSACDDAEKRETAAHRQVASFCEPCPR